MIGINKLNKCDYSNIITAFFGTYNYKIYFVTIQD